MTGKSVLGVKREKCLSPPSPPQCPQRVGEQGRREGKSDPKPPLFLWVREFGKSLITALQRLGADFEDVRPQDNGERR